MVAKKNALVYSVHFIVGESSKNIPYPTKYLGYEIVGHKVKGRISKRVFQENKACQIFRKANISYPLIRTGTCQFYQQGTEAARKCSVKKVFLEI